MSGFDADLNIGGNNAQQSQGFSLRMFAQPSVVVAHVAFQAAALTYYFFANLFSNSFIIQFLVILILLSMDFWTVKNITGRLLVGLRWWNFVDAEGNNHWKFESAKDQSRFPAMDRRAFWFALLLAPLCWLFFVSMAFFTFRWEWMVVALLGLVMTSANLPSFVEFPARPPTRHGRESASAGSSNEENKEPSPKSPLTGELPFQTMRIHDGPPRPDDENDDFLSKLNALRRRSLVASGDATERKIPNGEEKKTRDLVRQRNEIKEESEEEKAESRRPSTSSSRKTFRIGELSSATVVFKEEKSHSKPKLPPKYMGTPSTSDGHRQEGNSNHSKWLRKKMEEEREKRRAEEEEKMRQKQTEDEKKKNAQKTFEKWKETHMEKRKETIKEEKKREKHEEQENKEKQKQKKEEAQKTFEAWKKEREKRVAEEKKRKTTKEKEEKERKEEEAKAKREEAEKAFLAWKAKKEEKAEEEKSLTRPKQKEIEERKKRQQEYKEIVAQQAFETWIELKDVQYQQEQLLLDMPILETRAVPWIPPSNTVPRQFTPNTNRRRKSLDRRPRLSSASTVRRSNSAKSIRR